MKFAWLLLLLATAHAETSHVTVVRNLQPTDPSPVSRAFRVFVIERDIGAKHFSWGSQEFIVGEDYTVMKQDTRSLTVLMHDKKGHEVKERLDITGITEKINGDGISTHQGAHSTQPGTRSQLDICAGEEILSLTKGHGAQRP